MSMRNCRYVDDEAISRLAELQGDRLRALLLASCPRVTLNGLRDLKRFRLSFIIVYPSRHAPSAYTRTRIVRLIDTELSNWCT